MFHPLNHQSRVIADKHTGRTRHALALRSSRHVVHSARQSRQSRELFPNQLFPTALSPDIAHAMIAAHIKKENGTKARKHESSNRELTIAVTVGSLREWVGRSPAKGRSRRTGVVVGA